MELVSIGKFIAENRKKLSLTQEQLGEILGVTNKTVSRWETGTYLPPADILLRMSELFGVSINEILSGRVLSPDEYKAAAEQNLREAMKESAFSLQDRVAYFKKKWLKEHAGIMVLAGIILAGILIAGLLQRNALMTAGFSILLLPAHCWRHNAMMAYVEKNAFDGRGPDGTENAR